MAVYKPTYRDKKTGELIESKTYWYEFQWKGQRIRKSTKIKNERAAINIEAAHRVQLAQGNVGIIEKVPAPGFTEFVPRFKEHNEQNAKPKTVKSYEDGLRRLLLFPALAGARMDAIDEEMVQNLKHQLSRVVSRYKRTLSPSTMNGVLRTLRHMLMLAQEWKVIDRVPRIRMFAGEITRDFVLSTAQETLYLGMAPELLTDVAMLILDTGVRPGEACELEWKYVHLDPAQGARFGRVHIFDGKSKNAKRNLALSARVTEMLARRKKAARGARFVFPGENGGPGLVSSLDHQHAAVRKLLKLPATFVVHSLRHTMLTRLGESGCDAFTIMKIAGHSSITVSQRYVHPSPELVENAFEKLDAMNVRNRGQLQGVPQEMPQVENRTTLNIASNSLIATGKGA